MFGNVDSSLDLALSKAQTLHTSANGPFDLLLLIATEEVLASAAFEKLQKGELEVGFTTYLVVTRSLAAVQAGQELPFGLDQEPFSVGQKLTVYAGGTLAEEGGSVVRNVDGLQVGWTSDSKPSPSKPEKPSKPENQDSETSTGTTTERSHCDILISSTWPAGILTHLTPSKLPKDHTPGTSSYAESEHTAKMAVAREPRYMFVSNKAVNVFWERLPYRAVGGSEGDKGSENRTTRFISLGKFGGPVRWFYAFNIDIPYNGAMTQVPPETTANPFTVLPTAIDLGPQPREPGNGVERFDTRKRPGPGDGRERRGKRRQHQPPIRPETCFLCLSNPAIAKHLIVSVATKSYIALAKGPLVSATPLPAHVLIVPIEHVATLRPEEREAVELERSKYAVALSELFKDEVDGASTVMFEISRSRGIHLHTQVCAVPGVPSARIADAFKTHTDRTGLSLVERSLEPDETEYFRVQIMPPLGPATTLVAELPEGTFFDAQLGRKVLAGLLGLEDRVDWRACAQTESEEKEESKVFRDAFKKYDFTL